MNNVLIIGLGLIGGSYALGLKKCGYTVYAIDIDTNSIDFALKNNYIHFGSDSFNEDFIKNADIIIFGVYPRVICEILNKYQHLFKKNVVITDVTGVKLKTIEEIDSFLREDVHFIPSHPMAGREVSTVKNADDTIFHGANFIITPYKNHKQFAIDTVIKLAKDLNFKHIELLSPQRHDEVIGFVSQLTHAIAVSLMNCKEQDNYVKYTGDSFRDLTRIAMINENLWCELFFQNKNILVDEIDEFLVSLENLKQKLISGDENGLKELFKTSTNRRKKYLKDE